VRVVKFVQEKPMASVQEDRRRNLKDQEKRSRPRSRSGPDDRGANRPLAPRALDLSQRRVGSLSTDPKNARTHDDKQIAQLEASIVRFGFTNPVLIDERDVIIAGHARLAAAIGVGLDVVPAIVVAGLSEAERRALVLADNKIALNAGWDEKLLATELEFLADLQIDLDVSITGFDTVEIDRIIASASQDDEPAEEAPPLPAGPAISRPGDIWNLGAHRVACGNALEDPTFAALMGTDLARMAFLDAPYNVPIDGHVSGLGKNHHREFAMGVGEMSPAEFTAFLTSALLSTAAHSIDGAIIFSCMDWRHLQEMAAAGQAARLELKNLIVWAKDNGGMGAFYRSAHELVFAFKHGSAKHLNNFGLGGGGRYRTNVWTYPGANTFRRDRDADLAVHPTVKPIALVADAIMDVSHRGDIVLDPFGGSGTTLLAAEKTKRVARLIELDPLYVDVIVRRWLALGGKQALLASTGRTFAEVEAERVDGSRDTEEGI
jgi:DNA modification methylase